MNWRTQNIGALVVNAVGGTGTLTAAGSGDATAINGASYDRLSNGMPRCCVMTAQHKSTLTSAKTLSMDLVLEHSTDNSNWSAFSTLALAVVATGASGGSTQTGIVEKDVDLTGAYRYIRVTTTPDLSHTGTDTAVVSTLLMLAGHQNAPV